VYEKNVTSLLQSAEKRKTIRSLPLSPDQKNDAEPLIHCDAVLVSDLSPNHFSAILKPNSNVIVQIYSSQCLLKFVQSSTQQGTSKKSTPMFSFGVHKLPKMQIICTEISSIARTI